MADSDALPWRPYPEHSDAESVARTEAFLETMRTRRSCRHFTDREVPREVIEAAILAAGTAPSGANHQPWHFAAISSPGVKLSVRIAAEEEERSFYGGRASREWLDAIGPLGTDANKPYLEDAPWLIVVFAQRRGGIEQVTDTQNYYVTESVGIACGLLLAALHEAGLATLTHTPNPMRFLNRVCQRPAHEKPMMIIVAGHAAPDATIPAHALKKKSLEQIASWL
ncbi:nitroreductase family protein [Sphingomonas sp. G-3-2-10]|uniref:nitroreductase family protein n=1 Tax=Sphingomonas sp. G-3-2-10 TaxID=2728838 RepID=UPI00146A652D|nr:nitroreductase family protein [Sphingomonas sp. G-3-2-10]NML06382.1 nitroreductase family protein [Sphingomonas sp. G-3-2-10]